MRAHATSWHRASDRSGSDGGATTVDLLAAVCRAGALGFVGCAYSSPDVIRETAAAVRARTERSFRGLFVSGTATTVDEAIALEAAGVDAIVAQGSEAGAHRGTFGPSFEAAMIGTMALVPQIVDAVRVPVIASGGIMDGRGVAAALALGAEAAQLGTAFLSCDEAGIPAAYKQAIVDAREDQTRVTRAFSGRPGRGIVNRLMADIDREADAILPFPLQNALTFPARTAAAREDRAEYLSLWAGQGVRLSRQLPAEELVKQIVEETATAIDHAGILGGVTA